MLLIKSRNDDDRINFTLRSNNLFLSILMRGLGCYWFVVCTLCVCVCVRSAEEKKEDRYKPPKAPYLSPKKSKPPLAILRLQNLYTHTNIHKQRGEENNRGLTGSFRVQCRKIPCLLRQLPCLVGGIWLLWHVNFRTSFMIPIPCSFKEFWIVPLSSTDSSAAGQQYPSGMTDQYKNAYDDYFQRLWLFLTPLA